MSEIWDHYLELLTDPAHTLVELTFIVVVEVIILGMVWPFMKRHFHRDIERATAQRDIDHGHKHSTKYRRRM